MEDSEELLEPGCSFTWQWVGAAGVIASIQVRSEGDAVRLAYQRGDASESWKSEVWVLLLSFRTASSPPPKLCLVPSGGDQAFPHPSSIYSEFQTCEPSQ